MVSVFFIPEGIAADRAPAEDIVVADMRLTPGRFQASTAQPVGIAEGSLLMAGLGSLDSWEGTPTEGYMRPA